MDSEELARIAVSVPNQGVHQMLVNRFRGTPVGAVLTSGQALRGPDLTYVVDAVRREIERDRAFANALRHNVHVVTNIDNRGDYRDLRAGRDVRIKNKKYQIGSIRFGTGGLVSGVAVLVLALGGGTAAVVTNLKDPVALSAAVGRWEQPGSTPMQGFQTQPTVLTVTDAGEFAFSMGITMSAPTGFPEGQSQGISLDCKGTVTAEGDQFVLRTTVGACGTFTAKPTTDGTTMDVFVQNGSPDGSIALRKTGS